MKLIKRDTSHKVIAQGLLTMLKLSENLSPADTLLVKIYNIAKVVSLVFPPY